MQGRNPNASCKIPEPCEHVPQNLDVLREVARRDCNIPRHVRLGSTLAEVCATMRTWGAHFDRESSCEMLPDCMGKGVYTMPELRGIARHCGIDVRGKKTKADLCDALHAVALEPADERVHMRHSSGRRAAVHELDALREEVQAHKERPGGAAAAAEDDIAPQISQFLHSTCARAVFPKREQERVVKALAEIPQGSQREELARWLLSKACTERLPEAEGRRSVLPAKRWGTAKHVEVARAIVLMYLHGMWPVDAFGAQTNAKVRHLVERFITEQVPKLKRRHPELRVLEAPVGELARIVQGSQGLTPQQRTLRKAVQAALKRWCGIAPDELPEVPPLNLCNAVVPYASRQEKADKPDSAIAPFTPNERRETQGPRVQRERSESAEASSDSTEDGEEYLDSAHAAVQHQSFTGSPGVSEDEARRRFQALNHVINKLLSKHSDHADGSDSSDGSSPTPRLEALPKRVDALLGGSPEEACARVGLGSDNAGLTKRLYRTKVARSIHPDKLPANLPQTARANLKRIFDFVAQCSKTAEAREGEESKRKLDFVALTKCAREAREAAHAHGRVRHSAECEKLVGEAHAQAEALAAESIEHCRARLACPPAFEEGSDECLASRLQVGKWLQLKDLVTVVKQCREAESGPPADEVKEASYEIAQQILPILALFAACSMDPVAHLSEVLWIFRIRAGKHTQTELWDLVRPYVHNAHPRDPVGRVLSLAAAFEKTSDDDKEGILTRSGALQEAWFKCHDYKTAETKDPACAKYMLVCMSLAWPRIFTWLEPSPDLPSHDPNDRLSFEPSSDIRLMIRALSKKIGATAVDASSAAERAYMRVAFTCLPLYYLAGPVDVALLLGVPIVLCTSLYNEQTQGAAQLHGEPGYLPHSKTKELAKSYAEPFEAIVREFGQRLANANPFVPAAWRERWVGQFLNYSTARLLDHPGLDDLQAQLVRIFGQQVAMELAPARFVLPTLNKINEKPGRWKASLLPELKDTESERYAPNVFSPTHDTLGGAMEFAITSSASLRALWDRTVPNVPEEVTGWIDEVLKELVEETLADRFVHSIEDAARRHVRRIEDWATLDPEEASHQKRQWETYCRWAYREVVPNTDDGGGASRFFENYQPTGTFVSAYPPRAEEVRAEWAHRLHMFPAPIRVAPVGKSWARPRPRDSDHASNAGAHRARSFSSESRRSSRRARSPSSESWRSTSRSPVSPSPSRPESWRGSPRRRQRSRESNGSVVGRHHSDDWDFQSDARREEADADRDARSPTPRSQRSRSFQSPRRSDERLEDTDPTPPADLHSPSHPYSDLQRRLNALLME